MQRQVSTISSVELAKFYRLAHSWRTPPGALLLHRDEKLNEAHHDRFNRFVPDVAFNTRDIFYGSYLGP